MIVVSDTSPLNYLVLINAIDVLPGLFAQIYVPRQVVAELLHLDAPALVRAWTQSPPPWLKVIIPTAATFHAWSIDPGETDAILIAKELGAGTVLMDDRAGRKVAEGEGLQVIGTLTILEMAAEKGLVRLEDALARLVKTNFRIAYKHVAAALARDAAHKRAGHSNTI